MHGDETQVKFRGCQPREQSTINCPGGDGQVNGQHNHNLAQMGPNRIATTTEYVELSNKELNQPMLLLHFNQRKTQLVR